MGKNCFVFTPTQMEAGLQTLCQHDVFSTFDPTLFFLHNYHMECYRIQIHLAFNARLEDLKVSVAYLKVSVG